MILTCPITSQGFLTAAFQCFANEMCLQMTFGDQNRLLMEESAQVLGDILHNGLVNVDQGEDQTGLPGVFSALVNIPALLHLKGKRYFVGIAYITKHPDILFVFKELCVRRQIVQPNVDF